MIPASSPVPFGEWLPDMGEFSNPGAIVVKNCMSAGGLYKPFSAPFPATDALPARCKGAFAYRDSLGNTTIFAGTQTGLYKLNGLEWDEVTRLDEADAIVPYTMGEDNFWNFINYGTLVIATNYTDDIQVFDMASDTVFSQLSPTAPRCRTFFILNNFLVCLDISDSDGDTGYRVRWSPLGDPAGDWTDDPSGTQADFQDIYGGDYSNTFGAQLQDYGVIVQGNSIWRMDYVGGDSIFTIKPIERGRGSILPRSCIANGRSIFILSEDGFYEYNGSELISIGNNKVDKYFYSQFDETYDYNLNTVIDPLKKNVLWAFPSDGVSDRCDQIICFNWADRRWTLVEVDTTCLFSYFSTGYTLEEMDALYDSLDEIPYSLDSRIWTGGKTILGCFDAADKMAAFSGQALTATLQTTELRPNASGRATLHSLIPYITGGTIRARIGRRSIINQNAIYTGFVNQNSMTGEVDFLHDSVFFRAEFQISGDWSIATAVSYRAEESAEF